MRRLADTLLVLAFALALAPAQAGAYDYAADVPRAESFWHQVPSCGRPQLAFAALPASMVGDAYQDGTCRITIDVARLEGAYTGSVGGAYAACVLVAHEVGHLLGFGHSTFRSSVMYPLLEPDEQHVPQCRAAERDGKSPPRRKLARHRRHLRRVAH